MRSCVLVLNTDLTLPLGLCLLSFLYSSVVSISIASVALEIFSFSLTMERALFFELVVLADGLLFDGLAGLSGLDELDRPLSSVEAPEPLPPELPSLVVVVVVVVEDAGRRIGRLARLLSHSTNSI